MSVRRLPATRYQPSTSTKNTSLKGRAIITGGSIIMPMDMRTDATTMSMMRNGTNKRSRSRRRGAVR
jgi:hypothetical protein